MSLFDDIQKKKEEDAQKAAQERYKIVMNVKESVMHTLKESNLNVQEASLVLKTAQQAINDALLGKPLTDIV
jgi:hypothetical protein